MTKKSKFSKAEFDKTPRDQITVKQFNSAVKQVFGSSTNSVVKSVNREPTVEELN
ncbi:MAG: hypothetical protein OXC72_09180 [Roseovarius sp.]|nr:hypothetical protein [Roseovarius sp.]MCY4291915.1 hypothetical protein [Roseovarius sp.]